MHTLRRILSFDLMVLLMVPLTVLVTVGVGSCGRPAGQPIQQCGDGVIEGLENCDGTQLGGATCESVGAGSGSLVCHDYCAFDTSGCALVECGNGVLQPGESCDGSDLGGATCEDIGGLGGSLACGQHCALDPSGCVMPGDCGNGIIEIYEQCDVGTLSGASCASLGLGDGDLACGNDCLFDTGDCVIPNRPPVADAGADATALAGDSVQLDGAASTDPDGDALTYLWTAVGDAPPLDDATSAAPSFTAPFCGDYSYTLVVADGHVDSAPDTVTITVVGQGPYVSVDDCVPFDECGSLQRPWCTITGGVQAAQAESLPEVYVKQGVYVQDAAGAVPDTLRFVHHPNGDPAIRGGYTYLAALTRAPSPSCDTAMPGFGATVISVKRNIGVAFDTGSTHVLERFCVRSGGALTNPTQRTARVRVTAAAVSIRENIIDGSETGAATTLGILVENDLVPPGAPPVVLESNRDDPAAGIYFGGNGQMASIGIQVSSAYDTRIAGNTIHAGVSDGETTGVAVVSGRAVHFEANQVDGGEGLEGSTGLHLALHPGDATVISNTISGGSSPNLSVGILSDATGLLTVGAGNDVVGRPDVQGLDAYGIHNPNGNIRVDGTSQPNRIRGGLCSGYCIGVYLGWGLVPLDGEIIGPNVIRGGIPDVGSTAFVMGVAASQIGLLRVQGAAAISGADIDPQTGDLALGGLLAIGIRTYRCDAVEVSNNAEILGGGPDGTNYGALGVSIAALKDVLIEQNSLIQGCMPACGPGEQIGTPSEIGSLAGVGVHLQDDIGGDHFQHIRDNLEIRGGPIQRHTPGDGVQSLGISLQSWGAGEQKTAFITGNQLIVGNDATELDGVDVRPELARGIRIFWYENVVISGNDQIVGGRALVEAVGVDCWTTDDMNFDVTLERNGSIVGNPYQDAGSLRPLTAIGVRYYQPHTVPFPETQRLQVTGDATSPQDIGGGFAFEGSGGTVIGLQVTRPEELVVRRNRIWGGVTSGGDLQRGVVVEHVKGLCEVEANLIEACGVVSPGSAVHDPACEMLSDRSVGLELSDDVEAPCHVLNNLVFGGFSAMGSTGILVADHGNVGRAGQVVVYNNYVNAQGAWGGGCTSPPWADSRAVELAVAPAATGTTGEGLAFHNNIFDGGGRACHRYGVVEVGDDPGPWPGDLFDLAVFTHNAFVQALAGRDNTAAGTGTWAYREVDSTLWCAAGTDVVAPGQCLDGALAPGAAAGFVGNREGDPVFAGADVDLSERPGELTLADFHATGAVLQSGGTQSLPSPIATDYEGDPRDTTGPTCDIGHDETP